MFRKRVVIGVVMVLGSIFAWTGLVQAHQLEAGVVATVGKDQIIDKTLVVSGKNIEIAGTVNGDVYCAGERVEIHGTINGDVICAAQELVVDGLVDGDIRVAAQRATLSGKVDGNVTILGDRLELTPTASIARDVILAGSGINNASNIGRDLVMYGETARLDGKVGRNVSGGTGTLTLGPKSAVAGNLTYTSNNEASLEAGSQVAGEVRRTTPKQTNAPNLFVIGSIWFLYMFIALLLVSLVLVILFPALFERTNKRASANLSATSLKGLFALLAVPIVLFVVSLTLVGLPLAGLGLMSWMVVLMLSGPVTAYYLGTKLLRTTRYKQPFSRMLVGGIVLLLSYGIPVLGIAALLWAGSIGAGALLAEIFEGNTQHKKGSA